MIGNTLKYGNVFAAVEFTFNGKGDECINYLKLKKKKNELVVVENTSFTEIENLFESIKDANVPVCIIFNNKNVLTKSVSDKSGNKSNLIQLAFPNISTNDFFYEVYAGVEKDLVSIIRKEYVDTMLKLFETAKVSVIDFYLGNGIIKNIIPYLPKEIVFTSNSKIEIEDNEIYGIKESKEVDEEYFVNGVNLSSKSLLTFSAILHAFFNFTLVIKSNKESYTNTLNETYIKRRIFSKGLIFSLGLIFFLLLANFLFYSHYSSKIEELDVELSSLKDNKELIEDLQTKREGKKELINNFNSVLESKISWYLDEIAYIVPENILLKEISYQPLKNTIKKEKEILYEKDLFVVQGEAVSSYDVSKWVNELTELKWVDDVIVNTLENKKGLKNSFTLSIKITNEKE